MGLDFLLSDNSRFFLCGPPEKNGKNGLFRIIPRDPCACFVGIDALASGQCAGDRIGNWSDFRDVLGVGRLGVCISYPAGHVCAVGRNTQFQLSYFIIADGTGLGCMGDQIPVCLFLFCVDLVQ